MYAQIMDNGLTPYLTWVWYKKNVS